MFPESICPVSNFHPLPYAIFVDLVMVPTAARLLIQEDLSISADEAMDVVARSSGLGNKLHRLDEDDDEEFKTIIHNNTRMGEANIREYNGRAARVAHNPRPEVRV